jgi:transposase
LFIRAEAWQMVGATHRQLPKDDPDQRPQECPHHAFGRAVMVRRMLEDDWTVAAAAAAFEVSTRTVRKWLARFGSEGVAGLQDRSSAPHLVANKLAAFWLAMVTRLRRDYRMTGEEIAERLRLPRSTVASDLRRLGLGRLAALEPSERARRYNRARAGELVHLDVKKLARFRRIGHRITGDRRGPSEGAGWEFVHVGVDDASRLAYVEVLPDEKRQSVTKLPGPRPALVPAPGHPGRARDD